MRTNTKKLLVQRSPHKWTSKRSTGCSLAIRMSVCPHQYDCERIFLWSTDSRWIAFACSRNIHHISEWRQMLFVYTSTLCVLHVFSRSFCVRVQMWTRLKCKLCFFSILFNDGKYSMQLAFLILMLSFQVKDFRSLYAKVITDKHEDVMSKFGAVLAQGIIDAGEWFLWFHCTNLIAFYGLHKIMMLMYWKKIVSDSINIFWKSFDIFSSWQNFFIFYLCNLFFHISVKLAIHLSCFTNDAFFAGYSLKIRRRSNQHKLMPIQLVYIKLFSYSWIAC